MGTLLIHCHAGSEVTEIGVRGLNTLVHSGLMSAPREIHFDPLHRYVDIDGSRFPCDTEGAQRLESVLNEQYAQEITEGPTAIKVRENAGSRTGFDMQYVTERQGVQRELNVHLVPEEIDILQDPSRCDLIKPDVILRLNPPYLSVRRRLPDGHEIPIPELPDIEYRSATPASLQRMLNHPAVARRGADDPGAAPAQTKLRFREIHVVRHEHDKTLLWLECHPAGGGETVLRALTHQNVANLQHDEVFLEHFDIIVSLDNSRIGVRDRKTGVEQNVVLNVSSPDADLERASQILTASLRPGTGTADFAANPTSPPPASPTMPAPTHSAAKPSPMPRPQERDPVPVRPAPESEPLIPAEIARLFSETDPGRINQSSFDALVASVGMTVKDMCLSLPRVFDQRRFQILSFEEMVVQNVMDLRGGDFYGFYLTELPGHGVDLVYACRGIHIEWGVDKCFLQPALRAESIEYSGHALRGLAQVRGNGFLFIVEPDYKEWVKPHEPACALANAKFATVREFAEMRDLCTPIWPNG